MSRMTNPDNGMMENQQEADLGHPVQGDERPDVKGASVESPIPRLQKGIDADGLMEDKPAAPDLDPESEAARRSALAEAAAQPGRRH